LTSHIAYLTLLTCFQDLIISGDEQLQKALETFEQGDPTALEGTNFNRHHSILLFVVNICFAFKFIALLDSGALNRKSSVDLLDDLDLGFLHVGSLGDTPKEDVSTEYQFFIHWN